MRTHWRRIACVAMFKNISSKYVAVFTAIILTSFVIITVIMSSMLRKHSVDIRKQTVLRSSESIAEILNVYSDTDNSIDLDEIIAVNYDAILSAVKRCSAGNNIDFYLADSKGTVLLASNEAVLNGSLILEENISNKEAYYSYGHLHDSIEGKQHNYYRWLKYGDFEYVLVSSSPTAYDSSLGGSVMVTFIISSLWVVLAALLATYFISATVSAPLKKITKAADEFAKGNFNTRIRISGRDEIAELAETFNDMAEALENAERSRDSFLQSISHDLRTPMTTISGFADAMLDGTASDDKQKEYLSIISAETRRLARLVSTLLDGACKSTADSELKYSVFNVTEKTRQILLSFEQKIESKHLDIEFESEELFVKADADAIHQVIYNLIHNAVKFTPESCKISILVEKRDKKAFISIMNTGVGIEEKDQPMLFDRFYKGDGSRGLDTSGMGLGLFIVKNIITRHGERITLKSEAGKYCEFSFYLPLDNSK